MLRVLGCFVASILITGCAENVRHLSSEKANQGYQKMVLTVGSGYVRGTFSPDSHHNVDVYLRFFDSANMLGVCGFYVMPSSFGTTEHQLFLNWMAHADLYSGKTRIAPTSFLYARKPQFNEYDAEATCIQTDLPYTAFQQQSPVSIVGNTVTEQM
jgi:hypothetical protein